MKVSKVDTVSSKGTKPRTVQAPNPWISLALHQKHVQVLQERCSVAEDDVRALLALITGDDAYLGEHLQDWHLATQALLPKRLQK